MDNPERVERWLEVGGKAIAVGAVLLPAVTVGTRWLAFDLGGIQPGLAASVALPFPALVVGGFVALIWTVPMLALAYLLYRFRIPRPRRATRRPPVSRRLLALMPSVMIVAAGLIFIPNGAGLLISLPFTLAALFVLLGVIPSERRSFWAIVPGAVLLALSLVVMLGVSGAPFGLSVGRYTFAEGLGVPSGSRYIGIGQDDQFAYLVPCEGDSAEQSSLSVPIAGIKTVRYQRRVFPSTPSLWQVWTTSASFSVGLRPVCSTP